MHVGTSNKSFIYSFEIAFKMYVIVSILWTPQNRGNNALKRWVWMWNEFHILHSSIVNRILKKKKHAFDLIWLQMKATMEMVVNNRSTIYLNRNLESATLKSIRANLNIIRNIGTYLFIGHVRPFRMINWRKLAWICRCSK